MMNTKKSLPALLAILVCSLLAAPRDASAARSIRVDDPGNYSDCQLLNWSGWSLDSSWLTPGDAASTSNGPLTCISTGDYTGTYLPADVSSIFRTNADGPPYAATPNGAYAADAQGIGNNWASSGEIYEWTPNGDNPDDFNSADFEAVLWTNNFQFPSWGELELDWGSGFDSWCASTSASATISLYGGPTLTGGCASGSADDILFGSDNGIVSLIGYVTDNDVYEKLGPGQAPPGWTLSGSVPEPESITLFGFGIVALWLARRRLGGSHPRR